MVADGAHGVTRPTKSTAGTEKSVPVVFIFQCNLQAQSSVYESNHLRNIRVKKQKIIAHIMKKILLVLALVIASSALFVSQAQAGQGKGHKHHKGDHAHHHGKHHKA
jgi:hypothetical protein